MIEFKNVSKHFGPTQVLHNIDLNIAQVKSRRLSGRPVPVNRPRRAASTNWKKSPPAI
ncbi:hypothetical protein ACLK18_04730 [Escherichia coli]